MGRPARAVEEFYAGGVTREAPYRELTASALIGGVLVGAILNMGICFAGLQIGFTIVGSTVAAVLGFGILRGVLRKGSILEVNIFQTVASSVNTVNAGVIFTIPVLFLLGYEKDLDFTSLVLASVAGSMLGVVLIIPLRKQIIEFERLRFPEGTAVATILRAPGAGIRKSMLLFAGIAVSVFVILMVKEGPWKENVDLGKVFGVPATFRMVLAVSLLSLGAGFLAGRGGLVVLYGTLLNFWVLIPAAILMGWLPAGLGEDIDVSSLTSLEHGEPAETFIGKFSHFTSRHVGIGMILGGAVAGILLAAPALKAALGSLRQGGGSGDQEEADEVPFRVITIGGGLGLLLLLFATKLSGGSDVSWLQAVIVMIAGAVWLWVAGLVVAQTTGRTDWSPLSGLALIAIAIMMGILGGNAVVPAVTVGAAICVATSMCADMMADLKTGYLVGSRPAKQQWAQIMTCWIGPAIAVATVVLLWKAYAFGPDQADVLYQRAVAEGPAAVEAYEASGGSADTLPAQVPVLGAPQAGALESAINIVQSGDVPLGKYIAGAVIGILASMLLSPGIGVMVGLSLYLPFEYMAVFGIGGILSLLLARWRGSHWAEDNGVPVAAGLIVGDALVNIAYAIADVVSSMGGSAA